MTAPLLCALELDDGAEPVAAYARALAERLAAPLHGVHVTAVPDSPLPSDVEAALGGAEDRLAELLGATRAEAHVRVGITHTQILAVAERIGAQLVLLNTRARGPVPRALLGSTAEALLANADRSVLSLPDGAVWNPPRVVVVAHDFGDHDELTRASQLGAEAIHVVHALGPESESSRGGASPGRAREATAALLAADVTAAFGEAAARVSLHLVAKSPLEAIQGVVAETGPDLIVIGRSRRSVLARLLRSTTSVQLLRQATTPVLMVPSAS